MQLLIVILGAAVLPSLRRIAPFLFVGPGTQIVVVPLLFQSLLLGKLINHLFMFDELLLYQFDFLRIKFFVQVFVLLVFGWIFEQILVFQSKFNLVRQPQLDVLDLLSVPQLLREKLIEREGHPILIHACVGHNSKIDCALVFFDNRVGLTRDLIFVSLLEINVDLDQVLAHLEFGGVRAKVLPLLRLLLRHLRVYNIVLRPRLRLLENIIIFKCLLCPSFAADLIALSNHIIDHQIAFLLLSSSNSGRGLSHSLQLSGQWDLWKLIEEG